MALLYFPLQFVENVLHIPAGFSLDSLHTLEGALVILAVDKAHPVVKFGALANGVREEIGRRGPHQGGLGLVVTLSSPYLGVSMPPVLRRIPLNKDRVKCAIGDHIDRGVGKLHLARREKVWVLARDINTASTRAQRRQPQCRQLPESDCLIKAIATLPGEQLHVLGCCGLVTAGAISGFLGHQFTISAMLLARVMRLTTEVPKTSICQNRPRTGGNLNAPGTRLPGDSSITCSPSTINLIPTWPAS